MNRDSNRKWGQGRIHTANKRHRITTEPAANIWESDDVDEENPFDCIDRLLDQRDAETKQKHDEIGDVEKNDTAEAEPSDYNETSFSQHGELTFSQYSQFTSGPADLNDAYHQKAIVRNTNTWDIHVHQVAPNEHFFGPTAEQEERTQQSAAVKRKQYSVIKSSTPRFTFQSTVKKSSLQTPATHRQSLPNRTLFSTQTTQKPAKLTKRHSFRKSLDKSPVAKDVRSLDCTPSFLPRVKRKEGTSSTETPMPLDTPHSSFASLKSSLIHEIKPHASRHGKAGYLIQRLRSLRSNDQRMAMRLRSGQLSMRKRRRSGNEFDAKYSAKTELDVTLSSIASVFGESKSMVIGYIHRFEGVNGGEVDEKLKFPCFAWMLLSNDSFREQGLINGSLKQLRFYDAVVIPKRTSTGCLMTSDSLQTMPTIACGTVCEQYSAEAVLPNISFDQFTKNAYE